MDSALQQRCRDTLRMMAADGVERANSGHPGAPMGMADLAFILWDQFLRFDPQEPDWQARDRFVLSAGHASMLLYSLLHLWGFDLSLEDLKNFRQWGSPTPGHPEFGLTPGVEATTGPLGQGVANSLGMALAARSLSARLERPDEAFQPMPQRIFALCSDGDLMEGISSEAASLAGLWGLDNLIWLYDDNRITIDGDTDLSFREDMQARFEAVGWRVLKADGHDPQAISEAIQSSLEHLGQPSLIIFRTHIGQGSPNRVDTSGVHGCPLGAQEMAATRANLGWPSSPFHIPEEVALYLKERQQEKRNARARWGAEFQAWRERQPEAAALYDRLWAGEIPGDLPQALQAAVPAAGATRKLSNAAIRSAAELLPFFMGGSADLSGSNGTHFDEQLGAPSLDRSFKARQIPFGIREHVMAALCNGMLFHGGVRPFGATFLVFSDYQRAALRVAALSKLPNIFVFSHDSIFLGEDGPTHQAIEQHWSLRMNPNLDLFRPADGLEVAMAWSWALRRQDGPCALSLTRQNLPALERASSFDPEEIWRGGYALEEAEEPDLIFIGTGSEVQLCSGAATLLRAEGYQVRVVSMPCYDLFLRQEGAYQETLIPLDHPAVVSVEAGISEPWKALTGRRGLNIGIDRFGASAPTGVLAEKFGFTAEAVADRARGLLNETV